LGRYADFINGYRDETEVMYIFNRCRHMTQTPAEAADILYEIEEAAKLKADSVVNNSNLGNETTARIIEESVPFAKDVAFITKLPLLFTTVPDGMSAFVPNPFPIKIYVKKIWEEGAENIAE